MDSQARAERLRVLQIIDQHADAETDDDVRAVLFRIRNQIELGDKDAPPNERQQTESQHGGTAAGEDPPGGPGGGRT